MGRSNIDIITYMLLLSIIISVLIFKFYRGLRKMLWLKQKGILTKGKIKNVFIADDSEAIKSYKPTIEFTASDGNTYNFVPPHGTYKAPVKGDEVYVLYDEEDPVYCLQYSEMIYLASWGKVIIGISAVIFIAFRLITSILNH